MSPRSRSAKGKERERDPLELGTRQLPVRFQDAERDDLIELIAHMLDRLIGHNDQIPLTTDNLTRFHSRAAPSISVIDYLKRIARYTNTDKCCLLILLLYIDRVSERLPQLTITSLTVHRFVICSIAVASKALCDVFCTAAHYAKVGGIGLAEINMLEREFLKAIDWSLTCEGELLQNYYLSLVRAHPEFFVLPSPPPTPLSASPSPPASSSISATTSSSLPMPVSDHAFPAIFAPSTTSTSPNAMPHPPPSSPSKHHRPIQPEPDRYYGEPMDVSTSKTVSVPDVRSQPAAPSPRRQPLSSSSAPSPSLVPQQRSRPDDAPPGGAGRSSRRRVEPSSASASPSHALGLHGMGVGMGPGPVAAGVGDL